MYLKTTNFQTLLEKTKISDCQNKTLCDDDSSILVLVKNVIYKWVAVPDFWEGQMQK